MDPVNGISQLMQILRRKLAEQSPESVEHKSVSTSSPQPKSHEQIAKPSADEIQRKIGARIRALNEEDQRSAKATQIFVEAILVWEFGDDLLQDPRFIELSNQVVRSISDDSTASAQMQSLLNVLSKP